MENLFGTTIIRQPATTKIKKYIEIVASTNPLINAMGRPTQASLLAVLSKHYSKVAITHINNLADLKKLVAKKPDLVVLGVKQILVNESLGYDASPKIRPSVYLKQHGITFTGSDTTALALEFNKPDGKQAVIDAGLRTPAYFISKNAAPSFEHTLTFPLFVKPTNYGGSRGIDEKSLVFTQLELEAKARQIHADFHADVIIEEYLPGREFSVAIIKRPFSRNLLAMPIEFKLPPGAEEYQFLSKHVREEGLEKTFAVTDPQLKNALNALAIGVFKTLGSRDYGRIDVRLDAQGAPSFIEANLMPGMSDDGYLWRCFNINNGTSYEDMVLAIVDRALERSTVGRQLVAAV